MLPFFSDECAPQSAATIVLFVLELLGIVYVFIGLTVLTEERLMPCLNTICQKWKLSEDVAGSVLIAVGSAIPELTTNMISMFSGSQQLVEFGLGSIVGSGVFDLTMCLGIAALFTPKHGLPLTLRNLLRDVFVYLISIGLLLFFFADRRIVLFEAVTLVAMWPMYVVVCLLMNARNGSKQKDASKDFLWTYGEVTKPSRDEDENGHGSHNEAAPLIAFSTPSASGLLPSLFKFASASSTVICWPWRLLYRLTIPDCQKSEFAKKYLYWLSFLIIVVYTGLFSNILVMFVKRAVCVLGLSHAVVGLTMVAWGSDIGDTINSVIAAKRGSGDMAVCSALGSQILNIHLCLGIPWLCSLLLGHQVVIEHGGLLQSIILLFVVVVIVLLCILAVKVRLIKYLSVLFIPLYFAFLVYEWKVDAVEYAA